MRAVELGSWLSSTERLYLAGVESPYAIFVAIPGEENNRGILFLPEKYQFAGAQFRYDDDRFRDVSWKDAVKSVREIERVMAALR